MSSRITPKDIESQEFKRKMRGLDEEEVTLFLRSVAEEVERLNLENGRMREELGQLRKELEGMRAREKTLQQTLVSAQTFSQDMREKARSEGELLVREARQRADQMLAESRQELVRIESEIRRSKLERETLERSLRSVIDQHLTMLDMRSEARGEMDNLRVIPQRTGSEAG